MEYQIDGVPAAVSGPGLKTGVPWIDRDIQVEKTRLKADLIEKGHEGAVVSHEESGDPGTAKITFKIVPGALTTIVGIALNFSRSRLTFYRVNFKAPPAPSAARIPGKTMSEMIKHVSDNSFDQDVLKSQNPVLVDFWAEWCGPCKMFAPVLDEVAKTYHGKLTVAKLDIDANPATPGKYGIRGIPTVILYKGGQVHAQKVGALTKSQLTAFLDSNL